MMRRAFAIGFVAAGTVAVAAPALAQQSPPLPPAYVFGDAAITPETPIRYGLGGGFGVPITSSLTFELSAQWRTDPPVFWQFSGLDLVARKYEVVRRELLLGGAVTYRPPSVGRVTSALVLGALLNSRSEYDYVIQRCAFPDPCMPVARTLEGGEGATEPGVLVGADFQVPLGRSLEIGPSFRVSGILRRTCKTRGRSCTTRPEPPGSVRVDVGVKVAWLLR